MEQRPSFKKKILNRKVKFTDKLVVNANLTKICGSPNNFCCYNSVVNYYIKSYYMYKDHKFNPKTNLLL
jgi:hypothetical protein